MDSYRRAGEYADKIEGHLRTLGVWREEPLPDSAFDGEKAFFADTMTFYQWLQFVLLERIRETVAEQGTFPRSSQVGAYAIRELDGCVEASELISTLCEFDALIERGGRRKREARTHPEAVAPAPAMPTVVEPPALVNRQDFWRSRVRVSIDGGPAERVFNTASELVGFVQAPEFGVVRAERGLWVVKLVYFPSGEIDGPASAEATRSYYLRLHQAWPPGTETDDRRGRAMQFWYWLQHGYERFAREILADPEMPLPTIGAGYVDEFVWFVEEAGDEVRVLVNTQEQCRLAATVMVEREGRWMVKSLRYDD